MALLGCGLWTAGSAVAAVPDSVYLMAYNVHAGGGLNFAWNLRHKSMDHDNICNMDQTVFFCFYLWESGDRIVFSTYFISDVEKGTER